MDPEEEVQRIEHDLSCEEKGSFAELFQGRFRKAGILVVDRWGRRPTLLTGIGTMGAANAILVLAYALNSPATFTLLGILLFTVGFNFGYGSLVWVYASESFPVRLRTQGGSAMLTADRFSHTKEDKLLPIILLGYALGSLGGSVTFGIFFALALVSFAFFYVLAPRPRDDRWKQSAPTGTTADAGPRRAAPKPSVRPGSDPPSRPQQVYLRSGTSA